MLQVGEDLVGCAAGAVDPVVEDDDPLLVVPSRLRDIVDHEDAVQVMVCVPAPARRLEDTTHCLADIVAVPRLARLTCEVSDAEGEPGPSV